MGNSASALIACGIDLSENCEREQWDSDKLEEITEEDSDLHGIFGFTEPFPPVGSSKEDWDVWRAKRDAAIPVSLQHGGYQYGDVFLVITRTAQGAHWDGPKEVDFAKLTLPTEPEIAALNKVLDAIGYSGDRTPKFLLSASYG